MKYLTEFIQNKKVTIAGAEKEIKEGSFTDESGALIEATIWRHDKDGVEFPGYEEITPGHTFEANPWLKPGSDKITLYPPRIERTKPSTYQKGGGAAKTTAIREAQERKEKSIAIAQDRSAWMWAKNNASMLVANHPFYKDCTDIEDVIEDLATKIYNFEPLTPFNG